MARSADIVAEKTGLGRSFVGVVMLATATSLPELGTGVSSITLVGDVNLAAGDAFGSNLFNLLIIGLMDIYWRKGPVLGHVSPTAALVGVLGVAVISTAAIAAVIHHQTDFASTWYISPLSVLMFGIFLVAMYLVYKAERGEDSSESDKDDTAEDANYADESLARAVVTYVITASIVVASAVWLAFTGDHLAEAMGWEASFVGTQFLAFSTSLPEIAASFAALRLGAPELAFTNVLGSNLFNMGFVLFLDDVAFTGGSLWYAIDEIHILTAVIAILMTAIVVVGIQNTTRQTDKLSVITVTGASMIALYIAASVLVFTLA